MSSGLVDPRSDAPRDDPSGGLRRVLAMPDVAAIYVGNVLGSGIFVAPAAVAAALSGHRGLALWIAGGFVAACGALVYAECGARLPRSGGFYVCYRAVYGEAVAFAGGWAALLVTYPASIAAIALIFGAYLGEVLPLASAGPTIPAAAAIAIVALLNISGIRIAAWTQRILTGTKVTALAAICLAAIAIAGGSGAAEAPEGEAASPGAGSPAAGAPAMAALLGAMVVVLWTYDGWSDISMVAGEVREPGRTLGRAVILGTCVLLAIYLTVQISVGVLLPAGRAAGSERVFAEAVESGLGGGSAHAVALLIVLATFGSVHGVILAASRLGWAMANDGVFFRWFGRVDPRRRTPARAVAVLSLASIVYVFAAGFRNLLAFFSFTVWLFYMLTAVGLLLLRKRRAGAATAWAIPGSRIAPAVLILTGAAMSTSLLVENPLRSLTGLAIILVAIPVHALWRRLGKAPPPGEPPWLTGREA